MPNYYKRKPKGMKTYRRRRKTRGGSLWSWIKNKAIPWIKNKALPFLKKSKLISRTGKALSMFGIPYAGMVGSAAGAVGYGDRKGSAHRKGYGRGKGGALSYDGGALGYMRQKKRSYPVMRRRTQMQY